jgi:hypothetical protein
MWTGLNWLRIVSNGEICCYRHWTFGIEMRAWRGCLFTQPHVLFSETTKHISVGRCLGVYIKSFPGNLFWFVGRIQQNVSWPTVYEAQIGFTDLLENGPYETLVYENTGVAQSVHWLGHWLDERASIPSRGKDFFSSFPHPDRHWDPPSFLSSGYRGSYAGNKDAGAWSWPLTFM